MSHKMLNPFLVKVSILGYFPIPKTPVLSPILLSDGQCPCISFYLQILSLIFLLLIIKYLLIIFNNKLNFL